MINSKILSIALASVATLVVASAAHAQPMPGDHPAYLHALSDLREARGLLERPGNAPQLQWDEHVAIKEIDGAIKEIKDAAIDDGKNLGDHPAVDTNLDWKGRLHASLTLLEKAHEDASGEEDNNAVRGLRKRALKRIDAAAAKLKQGIAEADAWKDASGDHPAYLHALADLRAARAHLDRPAGVEVKWDEHKAVKEIDAAIHEIKKAAVDDGKQVEEHEPVDASMDWGGRLHHCLDLVVKARADIQEKEDNKFAHGLRRRANDHLDLAIRFIKQGITNAEAARQ